MSNIYYLHTPMAKATELLPNNIRYWRKQRGLTLDALSQRIGISKQMLGMLERGERQLYDKHRIALARELDIDPADLFLAEQTPFTVPAAERDFWRKYLSLDAHGRNVVRGVAENMLEWKAQPGNEDEPKRA